MGEVIRCNTVPPRGTSPDFSLGGGFSDTGSKPSIAQGSSYTVVAYTEAQDEFMTETILNLASPGSVSFQASFPIADWHLAPSNDLFNLFLGDGATIDVSGQGPELQNDGGLSPVGVASTGSFALATSSGMTAAPSTVLLTHQGSQVVAAIFGPSVPPSAAISAAGETPVDPLAAAMCNENTFGLAYGLSGGKVAFRTIDLTASVGAERVIATGFDSDVIGIGMAAVDGGVLIAAGTPTAISVFAVPCS